MKGTGIAIAMAAGVPSPGTIAHGAEKTGKPAQEISPVEDLMREHGVLARALLISDLTKEGDFALKQSQV